MNIEAEQALLGSLLVNNEALFTVDIEAADFSEPLHKEIFGALSATIHRGRAATPITVKSLLSSPDDLVGNELTVGEYLVKLMSNAVSVVHAPDFAAQISFDARKTDAIRHAEQMIDLANKSRDPSAFIENGEVIARNMMDTVSRVDGASRKGAFDVATQYINLIKGEKVRFGEGVPLCLPEMEAVLSDNVLRPGNLYGLLSSSGEGKTSFTLQQIKHAVDRDCPVLFLSFDQTWEQCLMQISAQSLGIEYRRQMQRNLSSDELDSLSNFALTMAEKPFEVIKCSSTYDTASRLASHAKRFIKKHRKASGTPLIAVDHIGAIKADAAVMREDAGTKAASKSQQLKEAAEDTGAAVLLLNQRSSYGMRRPNPRPIADDIYGGQGAMYAYDAIMYLYRAEKYYQQQKSVAANDREREQIESRFPISDRQGKAELGLIKGRYGDLVKRRIKWEGRYTRYISDREFEEELPINEHV